MDGTDSPRRERRRLPLLALLAVGALVASLSSVAFSLAYFTSSATVGSNTFTTGTIVLTTTPATTLLSAGSLMPGDTITAPLVVASTGTDDLRYSISASSTNNDTKAINSQILISIRAHDVAGNTCTAFDGAQLYGGLNGAAITATTMTAIVGNPAQGPHTGDRPLTHGTSETLCFRASLPLTVTATGYQNATTTYTFQFDAEQTKNNPVVP